jgi:hypothetical protein
VKDNTEDQFLYMPLTRPENRRDLLSESTFIEALLLRVVDAQSGVFQRIDMRREDGVFYLASQKPLRAICSQLSKKN